MTAPALRYIKNVRQPGPIGLGLILLGVGLSLAMFTWRLQLCWPVVPALGLLVALVGILFLRPVETLVCRACNVQLSSAVMGFHEQQRVYVVSAVHGRDFDGLRKLNNDYIYGMDDNEGDRQVVMNIYVCPYCKTVLLRAHPWCSVEIRGGELASDPRYKEFLGQLGSQLGRDVNWKA